MNLACSFIQPIEGRLMEVLTELMASNKIRRCLMRKMRLDLADKRFYCGQ